MIKLISIDPGLSLGWATFVDGCMTACGLSTPDTFKPAPANDVLVIEKPETYAGRAAKGDGNNLIALGVTVGRLREKVSAKKTIEVLPKQWKGQIPKPSTVKAPYIVEERVRRILTPEELGTYCDARALAKGKAAWDLADGVAIGLWHLGRFRR